MKHINESIRDKKGYSGNSHGYHLYFINYIENTDYLAAVDEIMDIAHGVKVIRIENSKIKRNIARNFGLDEEGTGNFYRAEDAIDYAKNNIERVFKKSGTSGDIWIGIARSISDFEWEALVGYINSPGGAKIAIIK